MRDWLSRHALAIVAALAALTVLLGVATAVIAVHDARQSSQLDGVAKVGPCRDLGAGDPECRRQSRLIVRACLGQRWCAELLHEVRIPLGTRPEEDR